MITSTDLISLLRKRLVVRICTLLNQENELLCIEYLSTVGIGYRDSLQSVCIGLASAA